MSSDDSELMTASGLPVSLDEIQEFDDDYSEDESYQPVPISKVNSFTAPEEEEVVYRGYAGFQQSGSHVFGGALKEDLRALQDGKIGKPSLVRLQEIPITERAPAWASIAAKPSFADEANISVAPKTPFHLIDTHFYCKYLDLNSVVNATEKILRDIPEVSRAFESSTCVWTTDCVDVEGSAQCTVNISVYKAKKSSKNSKNLPFIIECNRMKGDHGVFRRVYATLQEELAEVVEGGGASSSSSSGPTSVSTGGVFGMDMDRHSSVANGSPVHFGDCADEADEATQKATIKLTLEMAAETRQEARLLAAQFFCDLTADEHISTSTLCASPACLAALIGLTQGPANLHGEEAVKYAAFLAISNLSRNNMAAKTAIIDAGVLPVVVSAITNGTHKDAHIRRECASILNSLTVGPLAKKVVSVLGYSAVSNLFPAIDHLKDERMKLHAQMARNNLMTVFPSA